jgi:predicted nucleic acid-binding protein
MKVVVTDANIFFDLIGIGALSLFFQLEHEVHTTVLVLDECSPEDLEELQPFMDSGKLSIRAFSADELMVVESTGRRKGLRPPDRSVLFHAQEMKGSVLSGDKDLRKECREMKLECHGILWCIAELHRYGRFEVKRALRALDKLEEINKWLPQEEVARMRKELGG